MTAFSWLKTQNKVKNSRAKRILHQEKLGNGTVVMRLKKRQKMLLRRMELQKTIKDEQTMREELKKIG